jgi:homoserine acetyltransferase
MSMPAANSSANSPTAPQSPTLTFPTIDGLVVLPNFRFGTGESLPELKLHYLTLGKPHRNAAGHVDNAVLLLHGTGGDAHSLMNPIFSNALFGAGQPLDITKYFLVLPDDIGHGQSSKPSDGLHAHFPAYDYDDMVRSQRLMLDQMKIDHLRLILGTSMGCMQSFVWAETYPGFMDALSPFACLPVQIAGRNYDPSPRLGQIATPVLWINSADDCINPPELGIAEKQVKRMPNARFILLPISDASRGHGTHTVAAVWKDYLAEFMRATEPKPQ